MQNFYKRVGKFLIIFAILSLAGSILIGLMFPAPDVSEAMSRIETNARYIGNIASVGGQTLDEAFYQRFGPVLTGMSELVSGQYHNSYVTRVCVLGIYDSFSVVLLLFGIYLIKRGKAEAALLTARPTDEPHQSQAAHESVYAAAPTAPGAEQTDAQAGNYSDEESCLAYKKEKISDKTAGATDSVARDWRKHIMKKQKILSAVLLIALIIALLISCGTSTADLAAMVQEDCVSQWEEADIPITITKDLVLTKKSKTEYTGLMTISLFGETEQVTMNVIYDGETFTWQIEGW
jgi:hypothetical protein